MPNIRPGAKVRELSKGMVTQLHLALVMAIDARLLFGSLVAAVFLAAAVRFRRWRGPI